MKSNRVKERRHGLMDHTTKVIIMMGRSMAKVNSDGSMAPLMRVSSTTII
jgi:hypothetical protein